MNFISTNATKILLTLLLAVSLFHVLILVKIIPYEITWGGRLKNDSEMYVFETFSLVINLFLMLVLLMKANYVKRIFAMKAINIILWIFVVLFALNTLGNLFAKTTLEKLFAVTTLLFSILITLILKTKRNRE